MSISAVPKQQPSRSFFKATPADPQAAESSRTQRLYRVIWRWHFYAGIIVAPVLMVMVATGGLYIFKDELEKIMYADVLYVTPGSNRLTIDEQLAEAGKHVPEGWEIHQFDIWADPARATSFYVSDDVDYRYLYVDPYQGKFLGEMGESNFFAIVLTIHRTMFVGTFGRIVVELVTCWTIVLLISGIYLWWPRKLSQVWGAWLPRLRRHPYLVLRDLHAVGGVYAALVALLIASTGLLYTYVWGTGYNLAAASSGAYDIFLNPPKSQSSAEAPRTSMDKIVAAAATALPGNTLSVTLPHEPDGAYVVFGSNSTGPTTDGVAVVDHATADVLRHVPTSQYPALGWWASWNYPLHIGSILGVFTKVLWLLTCVVLLMLPITGVWMWWQRRPVGQSGFPRRLNARVPKALVLGILLLAVMLPALGISIIAILLGEKAYAMTRRKSQTATS